MGASKPAGTLSPSTPFGGEDALARTVKSLVREGSDSSNLLGDGPWTRTGELLGLAPEDRTGPKVFRAALDRAAASVSPVTLAALDGVAVGDRTANIAKAARAAGIPDQYVALGEHVAPLLGMAAPSESGLDRAALLAHTALRAEQGALDRVMLHIPEANRARAEEAVIDFIRGLSSQVLWAGENPCESGERRETAERLAHSLDPVHASADTVQTLLEVGARTVQAATRGDEVLFARVGELGRQLAVRLAPLVESNEASTAALDDLRLDVRALAQVFGGARQLKDKVKELAEDTDLPIDQAMSSLQPFAEELGIGVVKLLQKVGPLITLAMSYSQGLSDPDWSDEVDDRQSSILLGVIERMQNGITPMRKEETIAQLRVTFPGRKLTPDDPEGTGEPVYLKLDLDTPAGSASMAQTHRGWMKDPDDPTQAIEVGVKVFRTGMKERIDSSLRVCGFFERAFEAYRTLKPEIAPLEGQMLEMGQQLIEMQASYMETFRSEEDAVAERGNSDRSRRGSAFHGGTYVPRTFASHSGPTVITMEFIRGRRNSKRLDMMTQAEAATCEARAGGPFARDNRDEARARVAHWAETRYGARPHHCDAVAAGDGWDVSLRFKDLVVPELRLELWNRDHRLRGVDPTDTPKVQERLMEWAQREYNATPLTCVVTPRVGEFLDLAVEMTFDQPVERKARLRLDAKQMMSVPLAANDESEAARRALFWAKRTLEHPVSRVEATSKADAQGFSVKVIPERPHDAEVHATMSLDGTISRPVAQNDVAEATRRVESWARQSFGMAPIHTSVRPTETGFDFELRFTDPVYGEAKGTLGLDGKPRSDSPTPDLTPRALRKTIRNLLAEFFTQLIQRHVHGDGQNGNLIEAGKGVNAWIDWGNTVKLRVADMMTPARMIVGMLFDKERLTARALIAMSDARGLPRNERRALEAQLLVALRQAKKDHADTKAEAKRKAEERRAKGEEPELVDTPEASGHLGKLQRLQETLLERWRIADAARRACKLKYTPLYNQLGWALFAIGGTVGQMAPKADISTPAELAKLALGVVGSVAWNVTRNVTAGWFDGMANSSLASKTEQMRQAGVLARPRPVAEILADAA